MKSSTTAAFRKLFRNLPAAVRNEGRKAYKLFQQNPRHPSLQFKKIAGRLYSARITLDYRAVGTLEADEVVWFWAGSHAAYDQLIARLRRG
jgi:hypothetical protein